MKIEEAIEILKGDFTDEELRCIIKKFSGTEELKKIPENISEEQLRKVHKSMSRLIRTVKDLSDIV